MSLEYVIDQDGVSGRTARVKHRRGVEVRRQRGM